MKQKLLVKSLKWCNSNCIIASVSACIRTDETFIGTVDEAVYLYWLRYANIGINYYTKLGESIG